MYSNGIIKTVLGSCTGMILCVGVQAAFGSGIFGEAADKVGSLSGKAADKVETLSGKVADQADTLTGKTEDKSGDRGGAATPETALTAEYQYENPCPWVLEKDYDRDSKPIDDYIETLGTTTDSSIVGKFREELRARVAEDEAILEKWKNDGSRDKLCRQAEAELERYDCFLSTMGHRLWFIFHGNVDMEKNNVAFDYAMLRTTNSNVKVMSTDGENVYFFQSGDRVFVEGDNLAEVQKQFRQMYYTLYFLQGLDDPEYKKYCAIADACLRYTKMAMQNNKPENVDYHPMPTPGKLNYLAPKALELAKKSDSYQDAIEVVFDADDWTVERNSIGVILRRKVGAWVIKQMPDCKRAFRCQFAEPYDGNDYGELILYGIGGGQFNIK